MLNWVHSLGSSVINFIIGLGQITQLLAQTIIWIFRPPFRIRNIISQMETVGVNSLPAVLTMAAFTGMVMALQTFVGFKRFNAQSLVGTVVALSMTRELGPVLTSFIVAGRAGSAMAAELGTMRVTEQLDALSTMAVNPIQYLIVPRFLAGLITLPLLTLFADIIGMTGGYLVAVTKLGSNPVEYTRRSFDFLQFNDVFSGIVKAAFFGMIIAIVGCHQGFYTEGGAEGVGKATTKSVVISYMLILFANYLLTSLFF